MMCLVMSSRSRLWLWYAPLLGGIAAALLFAAGFWLGVRGASGEPIGSPPPPPTTQRALPRGSGERLVLVLGDSLARGTGDESGRGFASDVLEFLRKRGRVEIANLAVNGAATAEVRELVSSPNVRALAVSADLILVSAGGNDLSHAAPRTGGSTAAAIEDVRRARVDYAANLRAILGSLRETNPRVPICVLGLYDPFEGDNAAARAGASVILGWNSVLQETALSFPGVLVVPTFDLFQGRPDRLGVDRFHPNREGYAAIAARIEQIIPKAL